jgi:Leucine-rich repeat (LRR) protein
LIGESLAFLSTLCSFSQSLENANLASHPDLERLDLSRNNIAKIAPGTFLGLSHLHELDLSINALRTVSSMLSLQKQAMP